jgi:hypothetical protein
LGSKGFFTIIFHNLEDRNRIFDGGPYFYNTAGLFLRFWTEKFSPEKEDFAHAPVWIRLYSLPQEFWLEEVLAGIGNTIGIYVKSSEATKQWRYTSYTRIFVYLNIAKPLPGSITLEYHNTVPKEGNPESGKDKDGFVQPAGKRRQGGRKQPSQVSKDPSTSNKFSMLQNQTENPINPTNPMAPPPSNASQYISQGTDRPTEGKEPDLSPPDTAPDLQETDDREVDMELEEQDLAGVDLEHLEHAYRQQKLYTIPRDQLWKVHKVFLNSSAGSSAQASKSLGIQGGQSKNPAKTQKDEKKRGRKSTNKLIQEIGNFMVNSGQINLISDSFPPLPTPPSS